MRIIVEQIGVYPLEYGPLECGPPGNLERSVAVCRVGRLHFSGPVASKLSIGDSWRRVAVYEPIERQHPEFKEPKSCLSLFQAAPRIVRVGAVPRCK